MHVVVQTKLQTAREVSHCILGALDLLLLDCKAQGDLIAKPKGIISYPN